MVDVFKVSFKSGFEIAYDFFQFIKYVKKREIE